MRILISLEPKPTPWPEKVWPSCGIASSPTGQGRKGCQYTPVKLKENPSGVPLLCPHFLGPGPCCTVLANPLHNRNSDCGLPRRGEVGMQLPSNTDDVPDAIRNQSGPLLFRGTNQLFLCISQDLELVQGEAVR